jgi:hypothetical protein
VSVEQGFSNGTSGLSDFGREKVFRATAMTFSNALTLPRPSSKDRAELLANESDTLKACDESAWTIVNSQASMLSRRSSESLTSIESAELIYTPLDFENDLFTARVYKRNYRPRLVQRMPKPTGLLYGSAAETSAAPAQRPSTPKAKQPSIPQPLIWADEIGYYRVIILGGPKSGATAFTSQAGHYHSNRPMF